MKSLGKLEVFGRRPRGPDALATVDLALTGLFFRLAFTRLVLIFCSSLFRDALFVLYPL